MFPEQEVWASKTLCPRLLDEGIFMAEPAEALAPADYIFVDSIPDLAAARHAERLRAESILDFRRNGLDLGADEALLLPIDALSTAKRVHEAATLYGEGSRQHLEKLDGLGLDCQRLVGEWYRKLRPEWFPRSRHSFDPDTLSFFSHGMSVRQMTENALTPMPDNPEEEARRVNERVEDETPYLVRNLGDVALKGMAIRTISECTDKAIADYAADIRAGARHRGYDGQVPEREKLAVRDITLDQTTGDRYEEQVFLPGELITRSIIQTALGRRGLDAWHLDKTRLHGAQILAGDGLMEFVELLDTVAGEEWCTNVFMGEEVAAGFIKNYAGFRQEALRRQEGQKEIALAVRNFVLDLAADNVDPRKAPAMVEEFVKLQLLGLGKQNPRLAADMFDEQTAIGLQGVAALEAAGRFEEAYSLMREVEKAAPGGGYCGAGSCGIERFDENSEEGERIKDKLDAKPGDALVKDNERSCSVCSKKGSIYYAYSSIKVNKLCTSCGSTQYKRTV
jgi:hypothetical protein